MINCASSDNATRKIDTVPQLIPVRISVSAGHEWKE